MESIDPDSRRRAIGIRTFTSCIREGPVIPVRAEKGGAAARRYAYYAITDHATNMFVRRMTDEKMLAQREQVRWPGRGVARP
jgi:hypothetical protein